MTRDRTGTRRPRRSPTPPAKAAVIALFRTTDQVRRQLDAAIEPFGITGQQYNVLRILRGALPEALPTLAIAARMLEQTPGITRLLDRLEKKRLVTRERCADDRRQVLCTITPAGLDLLSRMDAPIDLADAAAFGGLTRAEMHTLVALLEQIRQDERAG